MALRRSGRDLLKHHRAPHGLLRGGRADPLEARVLGGVGVLGTDIIHLPARRSHASTTACSTPHKMASMPVLKLLDDHPYEFFCPSASAGERFRALFREAWNRIPAAPRDQILTYWSEANGVPTFAVTDDWIDSSESHAQVTQNGRRIDFNLESFELLPKEASLFTIAHELAHVLQKALGLKPGGTSVEENEAEADSIALSWGFDRAVSLALQMLVSNGLSLREAVDFLRSRESG